MADSYMTPVLTPDGLGILISAINGGSITFTRIALGNGDTDSPETRTSLVNEKLSINISDATTGDGLIILEGHCTSSNVNEGFYAKELGVYAMGDDEVEKLYAYRYSSTDIDYFPAAASGRTLELTMDVVVMIGNAQDVTAILVETDAYASKPLFDAHLVAENPHQITAGAIGAAEEEHEHRAEDITDGILPVARGGTGQDNMEDLASAIAQNMGGMPVFGTYTGNGVVGRVIELGFTPRAILLSSDFGNDADDVYGTHGGMAIGEYGTRARNGASSDALLWNPNYTALLIVEGGFKVNYNSYNKIYTNTSAQIYYYIAFR